MVAYRFHQLIAVLLRRLLPNLGHHARAKPLGQLLTDLYAIRCLTVSQMLLVRVDTNKFNSLYSLFNHPVYRIISRSSNANYQNPRGYIRLVFPNLQQGDSSFIATCYRTVCIRLYLL